MSPRPLSSLYLGALKEAPQPGFGVAAGDARPLAQLLQPDELAAVLASFGSSYQQADTQATPDIRGVASLWSKWYFNALLLPALLSNLLLERQLPLTMGRVSLELDSHAKPLRLHFCHDGLPLTKVRLERFDALLAHLSGVVNALAAVSGASPRVFWSNIGNTFEHVVGVIEAHPHAWPDCTLTARELLDTPRHTATHPEKAHLAQGHKNPLYHPVRYITTQDESTPRRIRRLCCLRYLLPSLDYCGNCPISCQRHHTSPAKLSTS
ncbi:siderophore-iron reductase FhuF [Halomonas sp. ZH2S]|uniref:Siderophore-iron reductase FhuF n=1 Tax=Vreelandella zhuhanensis TaxID=2684210 RepID=A0A7X3KR53_9GAMM|nr:siderophore-iron reductase FhuF [Halomonas zhuhanensis]MWJ28021.1 siderophore-iron reductase FhuF [Halomonas zhuhanensis]